MADDTHTIVLTKRQLTLVRVACLMRLDRLNMAKDACTPPSCAGVQALADLQQSYDETRAMLDAGGALDFRKTRSTS